MGWIIFGFGLLMCAVLAYVYLTMYEKKPKPSEERIKELYDNKISTNQNRYAAEKERGASKARTDLVEQINVEVAALSVKDSLESQAQVTASINAATISENEARQAGSIANHHLINNALDRGQNLALYEFEEQERIKFQNEVKRMEEEVKWALVAKTLSSHQKIILIQKLIDRLYLEKDNIEKEPYSVETKQLMKADRDVIIGQFKGYIHAEGQKIVEIGEPQRKLR